METRLWKLIQNEAASISVYYAFLDEEFAKTIEAKPFVDVVKKIISNKRDHLTALEYLYQATVKEKPETETVDMARDILAAFREKNKLVK